MNSWRTRKVRGPTRDPSSVFICHIVIVLSDNFNVVSMFSVFFDNEALAEM